jgi:hypothetical protein
MWPPSEWVADNAREAAGWVSAAFVGLLSMWRTRLRMRRDLREDRGEEVVHAASRQIVDQLRAEVVRLSGIVDGMSKELRMELAARREAEERAINAERRASDLLARVQALEWEIGRMKA